MTDTGMHFYLDLGMPGRLDDEEVGVQRASTE